MSLYGLLIGISLVIIWQYFSSQNKIIPKKKEDSFIIFLYISLLFGARIYHVFDYWSYYSQNPIQILNIRGGGLSIIGAIIAGFFYILIFSKKIHQPFLKISDIFTKILPLAQSVGRFGNFFNHENPSWWIESILNFVLFLFLLRKKTNSTAYYLIGYGIIRFITEFFRNDTWSVSGIKIAQIISLFFILFGLILKKNVSSNNQVTKKQSR